MLRNTTPQGTKLKHDFRFAAIWGAREIPGHMNTKSQLISAIQ